MAKRKVKKASMWKQAVSADTDRQKKQASKLGYFLLPKNVRLFKETPGSRAKLDILPYIVTDEKHPDRNDEYGVAQVGKQWYKRPFRIHRGVGVSNEYVVCPTSVGQRCPICEYRAKRQKEGATREELTPLNATNRNLYVVIPKDVKDFEEEPHVWEVSQFLFQEKLNEEIAEDEDNACFPDLADGKTLRIRFTEEVFMKNKYAAIGRIDFEDRDEPYDESILKDVPNLDEVLQILSYKELEAKFYEVEPMDNGTTDDNEDEDEDDDEEEVRTPTRRKQVQALELDEEEEEEEDDDDFEEEEEEEEEDDFEEEEVKPVRRKPARAKEEEEVLPKGMTKKECVACEGSGLNSKGKPCKPCKGKGYTLSSLKKDLGEFEDDEEETPTKATKCPSGHVFGEDNDAFDECNSCDIWDDCYEANS